MYKLLSNPVVVCFILFPHYVCDLIVVLLCTESYLFEITIRKPLNGIILAAPFITVIIDKHWHELHGTVRQGAHLNLVLLIRLYQVWLARNDVREYKAIENPELVARHAIIYNL
jgi:hypothetical protein